VETHQEKVEKAFRIMKTGNSIKIAALLALAGSAQALAGGGFTGFNFVCGTYDDGFGGNWYTFDVYAEFTDDSWAVLNVFNADISTNDGGGFHHNDLADATGGSWKPSFSFDIAGAYDPNRDSYVTIGYGVGAEAALNQTALDPGFGAGLGRYIPTNAGWFNLTPDNPQYATGGSLKIAHFVIDIDRVDLEYITFTADIAYYTGPGSEVNFGSDSQIEMCPSPGALALLVPGAACARRRRR
jgi:hypothetical protein